MPDPRILYITGWMRSGSTLLGNLLGELPGVMHVGELHYLWRNGLLQEGTNSLCGCDQPIMHCPVWSRVIEATGAVEQAESMTRDQERFLRTRHTISRLHGRSHRPGLDRAVERTLAAYRELTRLGGDRLIVDSSKYPAEAAALLRRTGVDVRVLHIVRDPRATAFSYLRAKEYIDPMSSGLSSAYWSAFNAASEAVGRRAGSRYILIRHEDFCDSPRDVLGRVLSFAGLDDEPPVDRQGCAVLGQNHTVTGNPDRLRQGRVRVEADSRWIGELPARDRVTATLAALPLLHRYGYRLAVPHPARIPAIVGA